MFPLVLSASLLAGQAPADVPEPWPLMAQLQGTRLGECLEGHKLSISGWTDMSYTASSVPHEQLPIGFNYKANQYLLQQHWLRVEKPVDESSKEPTFGFRTDTFFGSDSRFTIARGLFSGQLTANDGGPNTYGVDPIQFYAEGYFPEVAAGLDVKLGRCFCQYGVEANDAPSSPLASKSYTFIYDPFTHTGLLTTLKLDGDWSVQNGLMLGCDNFIHETDNPTYVGSIKWAPKDGRDSVQLSVIAGSGRFDVARNFNNPQILDLVYTRKIDDKWKYTFNGLVGRQDNVPGQGTVMWYGLVNYLDWTISEKVSAVSRLELFDDCQGQRTGFAGLYTSLTLGLVFRPRRWLIFRPEARYDHNEESRPFQNHHGVATAAFDAIVRW